MSGSPNTRITFSQLCASPQLSVQESPDLFALRDATNEDLISDDNMFRKLESGAALKLVAGPAMEAADTIGKLLGQDRQAVKQATFSLRTFVRVYCICSHTKELYLLSLIQEEAFMTEFSNRNGVAALASVIQTTAGNTLAYALNAMQSLMDLDYGWNDINANLIDRVGQIMTFLHLNSRLYRYDTLDCYHYFFEHSREHPAAGSISSSQTDHI